MEQQIQQDAWGSARIARVSQQASTRTICKWLKLNYGHLVTLYLNTMEISCLGSDTRTYFETFTWSPKQFPR